jgi:O-antigen/teichoic acid export membrane protein
MARERSLLGMTADLLSMCGRHVAQLVAGLATVALVVRTMGAEGLGAWALLGTTGFLLGLSDLGLSVAVQRAASRPDDAATRRLVSLTFLVVAVVCPCLAVCAHASFLRLPSASAALQADLSRAALPVLVAGLGGSLASPLRSLLLVRGAFGALAWARAAASLLQVGLTAALLALGPSLLWPALGLLAGSTLELLLLVMAARRVDPRLELRPRWPAERAEVRDAFQQAVAALTINVGVAAAVRADVVILTSYVSLGTVGAYQVAARVVDQLYAFAKQTSGWLLHRLGDAEQREGALRLGTALLGGLVASGMAAMALDGTALLEAWVGPLARDPVTHLALGLLGTAAIIAAAEEVASATLVVGGATLWHAATPVLLGHSLNVAVSLLGVGYAGAWAVAGGTVCGNLLITTLVWSRARALVRWRVAQVLGTLVPMGAALLVSLGTGWALAPLANRGAAMSALVCAMVTLLGTGVALLVWWRRSALPETPVAAPPLTTEASPCSSSS